MSGKINLQKFREEGERQRAAAQASKEDATITQRAVIRLIADQRKQARVGRHTLICDEEQSRGGTGDAPSPLQYFVAALGF